MVKGVIVKASPQDLKSGWKVGDLFYEGRVKDGRLTGTAFIPFNTLPGCGAIRAKARFEAWLLDEGRALGSHIEGLGWDKGCKIVPTGRWTPLLKARRVDDASAATAGAKAKAKAGRGTGAARPGQPPQGAVSTKTPIPFTPRPVPDFNPVQPGNGLQPTPPIAPGGHIPAAPTPRMPQGLDIPSPPPGTPGRDLELFNSARRLLATAPDTVACSISTGALFSHLAVFAHYLQDRQILEQPNSPNQLGRQLRADLKQDMELVKSCGDG